MQAPVSATGGACLHAHTHSPLLLLAPPPSTRSIICSAKRASTGSSKKPPADAKPKRRGPKPTTSADSLQTIDEATLLEFKQQAALEEATRVPEILEPESEPQRFNFHRVLLNAASRGLTEVAEDTIEQMRTAGLPPGPRAYHALVFSYVRANQAYEALDAAARATDEDHQLLPETFVVLIYALLNIPRPPDVGQARMVLESMEMQEGMPAEGGTGQGAVPGWNMLCTELFRKGLIADAMTEVKKGNEKGYMSSPDLAKHVIEQLALAGLKDEAWQELAALVALGNKPGPDHYRHLIRAEAATGDWTSAHAILMDALSRPDWSPPNSEAFNALLQGIVVSINPDKGRIPSSLGEMVDNQMADGLEGDARTSMSQGLEAQFARLREEMLLYGFRPNAVTYATMCEGYIKLGDLDSALGSMQSMRDAGGSTQLVSKKWLSHLLGALAKGDRPMDLLNVLKSLVSANQRLPKSACKPITDDTSNQGPTIATVWLPEHFEYMRTHKDRGDTGAGGGGGGISSAASGLRALIDQALELREVDSENGIKVSNLGNCVVENDGSGVWVRPARMTTAEMQAELVASDIPIPASGKRKDFTAAIKAHRESLPRNVKDIQEHLEQTRKAETEALERKTGILLGQPVKPKKKGKVEVDTFRVVIAEDGRVRRVLNVTQEVRKGSRSNYSRSVGGSSNYDEDLDLVMSGGAPLGRRGEDDMMPDEVDSILKEGVDEGVGEIIRSSETIFGDTGDVPQVEDEVERDTFDLTIDFMEARMLNKSAGMSVAFEVLKCVEMLGGSLSGPDFEALVMGTVTEENVEVALELSQRLPVLLTLGYDSSTVASLYERLVRMCLGVLRGASADLVLERAEDAGLQVDPSLYMLLTKALAGRPRHRDLEKAEVQDMAEDTSVANILGDDQDAEEAVQGPLGDDEEEGYEGEEGEEDEDDEEGQQQGAEQTIDQLDPTLSHTFSFGHNLLTQLDEEAGSLDINGLEDRTRQDMGLPPVRASMEQQRQSLSRSQGQTIDADEAQFTHLAEPAVTALEQELMGEARMPWSVADEVELQPLGGKTSVLTLASQLAAVLEKKLGSEEAAQEFMAQMAQEGRGVAALMQDGLLTQGELEVMLTGAVALGTEAVSEEEFDAYAGGHIDEEEKEVLEQLNQMMAAEPLMQVLGGDKHAAEFARNEEDAEKLHALLDRYTIDEEETDEAESSGEGEEQGVDSLSRAGVKASRLQRSQVLNPEEALQVARLMPSPSEGGLASFFEHLQTTQVERVRQSLEQQYSDPNWLASKVRRQHRQELMMAAREAGQEEMDEAELDAIVTERDESGLPTLAFLPNAMQTDPDLFKEMDQLVTQAIIRERPEEAQALLAESVASEQEGDYRGEGEGEEEFEDEGEQL